MAFTGKAFVYGDDVNTDVIFPGKYTYTVTERTETAKHALEDLDPEFATKAKPGDVIIAGRNFGCGSSREQAAICLKELGIGLVVAESFSRIFFRNAINEGLAVATVRGLKDKVSTGDDVTVDLTNGTIACAAGVFTFPGLPPEVMVIVEAGGLIEYTKRRIAEDAKR
jgi:3-isopropylmalate/(R)-2-methylmalate dehydratase small subunit